MERPNTTNIIRSNSSSADLGAEVLLDQYLSKKYAPFIFLVDAQMQIHYTNVSEERPFFGRKAFPSAHLTELFDSTILSLIRIEIEKVLNTGKTYHLYQVPIGKIEEAGRVDLCFNAFPSAEDHGLVELTLEQQPMAQEDLSLKEEVKQLRQANEELHQTIDQLSKTNEYLDRFVSGAAHDLRGPLVVLKSYVDLIRRFNKEEKRLEALDHMKNATIRFENVVSGLVESIEFKKRGQCNAEWVNFHKVYEMVLFQLCTEVEELRPQISTDFGEVGQMFFIKSHLNSILYNLMSNAFKYRNKERALHIQLKSAREEEFVVLSVKDNGIGIDLNRYAEQLFQPFQRLTTQAEGIGVGLSLINRIAEENGGFIKVESTPDQGCCFKVFLKPYLHPPE